MSQLPDLLERLTVALSGLVRALEHGRADEVLEAEGPVAAAASELAALDRSSLTIDEADRLRVGRLTRDARALLASASRMGATSAAVLRLLTARHTYGRDGGLTNSAGVGR